MIITDLRDKMVSLKEKQKDNNKYYQELADSYIKMSCFGSTAAKDDLQTWYKVYNGVKIEEHYSAFEDPFGTLSTSNPMPLNDVKPWNIVRTNMDIIINEKEKRPWNYMATIKNADTVSIRNKLMQDEVRKKLVQDFINIANEGGTVTGVETKPTPEMESIMTKYEMNYLDQRAVEGQKLLNIAIAEESVREKMNRIGMKHWGIGGEVNTYMTALMNDLVFEVLNPMEIDFIQGPEVKYGRDGEAAIRKVMMPVSQILDNFRDILKEEELKSIIDGKRLKSKLGMPQDFNTQRIIYNNENFITSGTLKEVCHVVWRGYKKIGKVTFLDEYEQPQEIEIDETFEEEFFTYQILDIEWEWRTVVEEVYRIDGQFYAGAGEVPYTSRKMDNKSIAPLPYNRVKYSNLNSENTSLVREAYIYQFFWNIYKAKLERLIATDKGQVSIVDKAALADWGMGESDFDKTMYYIDTTKILFIDSRRDDMGRFNNWGSKLDMGQSNSVLAVLKVLDSLRNELDMSMGITPQRRGDVSPSAGKAATEYALEKSYTVSEGIFADFEIFEEMVLNDLINIAKIVYSRNKKGMYIVDQMPVFLNLDEMDIEEEEFGVYMSRATKDKVKLDAVRQLIQPFAQNIGKPGISPEMIIEMIESDNMSEIKLSMRKADESIKEYAEQQMKAQQQAQQQAQQAQQVAEEKKLQMEQSEAALEREKDILVAKIRAAGFEPETAIGSIDTSKVTAEANKAREALDKNKMERDKLSFQKKKHEDEMKQKEKERESKEKLKKMDLKNPVAGEK